MEKGIRPTLIGSLSIILWGAIIPLIKLVSEEYGTLGAVLTIHGLSGILGLVSVLARGALPRERKIYFSRPFMVRGLLFTLQVFCIYYAVRAVARPVLPAIIFCNYLWPTLVLIYSIVYAGVEIVRKKIFCLGVLLSLVALYHEFGSAGFLAAGNKEDLIACAVAIFGANCWAFYSAFTRKHGEVSGASAVTPLFSLISAAIALIFIARGFESFPASSGFNYVFLVAGGANFVAYLCWDIGVRRGNVVTLSLLADFIPWLSLLTTSLLLAVPIPDHTKISAAILVSGALLARVGTLSKRTL